MKAPLKDRQLAPQDGSAHWALGVTERDRKHLPEAVASLKRSLELRPTPAIVEDLAMVLVASGKADEAVQVTTSAAGAHARSLAFRLVEARVLLADRRCAPAEKVLAELPPDEPNVRAVAESLRKSCPAAARAMVKGGGKK